MLKCVVMKLLPAIFSSYNDKQLKPLKAKVAKINELEEQIKELSDEALKNKTAEFKERLSAGETLDDILPEAFAVVREASERTLGQRHFDVQLIGGIVLHNGDIAEMRTGEGKTLVATLPAYLNALTGKGVHVVTVNDYLARRDAVWMGQIYSYLGLSVGVINSQSAFLYDPEHTEEDKKRDEEGSFKIVYEFLKPAQRKEAYAADITYGTNNEFGFDYLRDNITYNKENISQRTDENSRYNYAIIDEVDSILIDESRTPLIISAPASKAEDLYTLFSKLARTLNEEEDYEVDEKHKSISLTDQGISKAEKALGVGNIYTDKGIKYVHHLETAVRAKALFKKDKNYVIKDGEVIIIDEFTGRLQPGRRWSEGLHQAIEAKEGVDIKEESRTYATVTLQNYFKLYNKLSGMTGTAKTSAEEFRKVYNLDTVIVPTNKEPKRIDQSDLIFQTENGKYKALTNKVKELQEKGQPVLVGTVSVEKNELLGQYFKTAGVRHEILNAKNHEQEGLITASAGKKGAVTIATNMAGRGVDIKLGGATASEEESEEVKNLGGLFVVGTERHEARRIDNQLRGRSGRQGDPGETQFYISLEDTLMRVFASDRIKNMMGRFGIPEDEPIQNKMISRSIESAQSKIEGLNFDARRHLLEYDSVVNIQRMSIYEKRRRVLLGEEEEILDFIKEGISDSQFFENYNKKKDQFGQEVWVSNVRKAVLQIFDMLWVEHLEAIDYIKNSVRLRAYGQRDPLVEFKKEGRKLFEEMEYRLFDEIEKIIPNLGEEVKSEQRHLSEVHKQAQLITGNGNQKNAPAKAVQPEQPKVGRNEPCPCGAKKEDGTPVKYKHCHGK